MCDVLDCRDANAKAHAIDLGIGMQLTNIARDVLNTRMGRRYLPGAWVNDMSQWRSVPRLITQMVPTRLQGGWAAPVVSRSIL